MSARTANDVLDPISKQEVASLSNATPLSLTLPEGAMRARISVETQAIRYFETGDAPTTSSGHPVATGVTFTIEGRKALGGLKLISQAASAKLTITYYR